VGFRRKRGIPDEWWTTWTVLKPLTAWIVLTGFSQPRLASMFPDDARVEVCDRLGVAAEVADRQDAEAQRSRDHVKQAYRRLGYAEVRNEWRPTLAVAMPNEVYSLDALCLLEAVVYRATGARCTSGPLTE
jgi:hypothetical protein